jgi:hypothetical protein
MVSAVAEVWVLGNEFAQVRVRLDTAGHDQRIEIQDMATGRRILLDAMMLAQIARAGRAELDAAMDPGAAAPLV